MKVGRNELIGASIVVVAVLVSAIIAGVTLGEVSEPRPSVPDKPFIIHVSREVEHEQS